MRFYYMPESIMVTNWCCIFLYYLLFINTGCQKQPAPLPLSLPPHIVLQSLLYPDSWNCNLLLLRYSLQKHLIAFYEPGPRLDTEDSLENNPFGSPALSDDNTRQTQMVLLPPSTVYSSKHPWLCRLFNYRTFHSSALISLPLRQQAYKLEELEARTHTFTDSLSTQDVRELVSLTGKQATYS